ncbi:MAG: carbohydrate ABC transporter permease [Anaerolineales bacterium]|jgi:alpha-glucoside transport system permease protein|nr:carbohydrate ABC transporter permease [Anaerolineales bacterium]
MAGGYKNQKKMSSLLVNGILILICFVWLLPTVGVFVTSLRNSQDIFTSGWWSIFPHQENIGSGEIVLDPSVNVDEPMQIEGITATFEELRAGVTLPDGRILTWYGNKRTRTVLISDLQWVGFFHKPLTTQNYADVLTGKTIKFTDASGNEIIRQGNNLGGAFLNSIAVAVPATIIPILIAAFAAYGFAWLNFPGRGLLFTMVVAILVVPLQISLVPILQDYTKLNLNGTYLGIWLAHTGFGLPLATYLLFNYMSTLPRDLLEAAYIDGASNFTIFTKLILPLSVPALASFAIFQFLWVWNDYLIALVFLGDKNRVITFALASIVGEKGQDWHLLTAGAFVSMIMPLAVFFALQRYFVRGLLAGSVKG